MLGFGLLRLRNTTLYFGTMCRVHREKSADIAVAIILQYVEYSIFLEIEKYLHPQNFPKNSTVRQKAFLSHTVCTACTLYCVVSIFALVEWYSSSTCI